MRMQRPARFCAGTVKRARPETVLAQGDRLLLVFREDLGILSGWRPHLILVRRRITPWNLMVKAREDWWQPEKAVRRSRWFSTFVTLPGIPGTREERKWCGRSRQFTRSSGRTGQKYPLEILICFVALSSCVAGTLVATRNGSCFLPTHEVNSRPRANSPDYARCCRVRFYSIALAYRKISLRRHMTRRGRAVYCLDF